MRHRCRPRIRIRTDGMRARDISFTRYSHPEEAPMNRFARITMAGISLIWIATAQAQQHDMTFFVTSAGKGNGADLGGIEGEDSAIVGHHDRQGLKDSWHMKSWNSSHGSRGCSQDQLKASGGAGLLYCFVPN